MAQMLTIPDVARALNLSITSIRRQIAAKNLHAVKLGDKWLVSPQEIERVKKEGLPLAKCLEP